MKAPTHFDQIEPQSSPPSARRRGRPPRRTKTPRKSRLQDSTPVESGRNSLASNAGTGDNEEQGEDESQREEEGSQEDGEDEEVTKPSTRGGRSAGRGARGTKAKTPRGSVRRGNRRR